MRGWVFFMVAICQVTVAGRVFDPDQVDRDIESHCLRHDAQQKRFILISRTINKIIDEETCNRLLGELNSYIANVRVDIRDCNNEELKEKLIKVKRIYKQFSERLSRRKEKILYEKNSYGQLNVLYTPPSLAE